MSSFFSLPKTRPGFRSITPPLFPQGHYAVFCFPRRRPLLLSVALIHFSPPKHLLPQVPFLFNLPSLFVQSDPFGYPPLRSLFFILPVPASIPIKEHLVTMEDFLSQPVLPSHQTFFLQSFQLVKNRTVASLSEPVMVVSNLLWAFTSPAKKVSIPGPRLLTPFCMTCPNVAFQLASASLSEITCLETHPVASSRRAPL